MAPAERVLGITNTIIHSINLHIFLVHIGAFILDIVTYTVVNATLYYKTSFPNTLPYKWKF